MSWFRGHPAPDPTRPGQESVWDYPRPPRLVADPRRVEVVGPTGTIASSEAAVRVCETASPPTFYVPQSDVVMSALKILPTHSYCEWKGAASYWALRDDPDSVAVAWGYEAPSAAFAALASRVSFYPGRIECYVAGERARPQPGGFYGGWITDDVAGPFKGEPGTGHW